MVSDHISPDPWCSRRISPSSGYTLDEKSPLIVHRRSESLRSDLPIQTYSEHPVASQTQVGGRFCQCIEAWTSTCKSHTVVQLISYTRIVDSCILEPLRIVGMVAEGCRKTMVDDIALQIEDKLHLGEANLVQQTILDCYLIFGLFLDDQAVRIVAIQAVRSSYPYYMNKKPKNDDCI